MPIKDKNYWKEYNAKRKAYIQQKNKERYLNDSQQGKGSINTTDKDTTQNNTTTDTTFNTTPPINTTELKKDTTKQIQPINTTQEEIIQPIQPKAESIQPLPCSHCLKSEKKIKELELKIISLQETNQILRKDLGILQEPTSPYEKSWKEKYLELEKKTDERWKELDQTIKRLKGKLREKDNKNKEWEQKYSKLENSNQNISKSPIKDISKTESIIPVLLDREKKKIILYSCPDPCYQGKFCSNCSASSLLSN